MKNNPYLSHTDKPRVIEDHEVRKRLATAAAAACVNAACRLPPVQAKVAQLDPLHRAIEADMVAMSRQNKRSHARVRGFFDVKVGGLRRWEGRSL